MEHNGIKNYDIAVEHLKSSLGEDAGDFLDALSLPPLRALRVNTLKTTTEEMGAALGLTRRSPYCPDAFVLPESNALKQEGVSGRHPYHMAGLFYLQEPSAMLAIEAARPAIEQLVKEKEYPLILDLCASPGGKSSYAAALMKGRGLLVSNEIEYKRLNPLNENLIRLGARNSLVVSAPPGVLVNKWGALFDAVIVDAPCSGEGMLRKERAAWDNMNFETMITCAKRQRNIVKSADSLVKEGGLLIYSTCTLNRNENEAVLEPLITKGRFRPLACPHLTKVRESPVFPAYRALPQDGAGEGHFVSVLRKTAAGEARCALSEGEKEPCRGRKQLLGILGSLSSHPLYYRARRLGGEFCLLPPLLPDLQGIYVKRAGVRAAEEVFSRILPCHDYALSLTRKDVVNKLELKYVGADESDRKRVTAYMRGETFEADCSFNGFGVAVVDGYPLGIIKAGSDGIKNRYPKGWRLR